MFIAHLALYFLSRALCSAFDISPISAFKGRKLVAQLSTTTISYRFFLFLVSLYCESCRAKLLSVRSSNRARLRGLLQAKVYCSALFALVRTPAVIPQSYRASKLCEILFFSPSMPQCACLELLTRRYVFLAGLCLWHFPSRFCFFLRSVSYRHRPKNSETVFGVFLQVFSF